LQKRSSISFVLPLAMLLLFTFSATPKRWLHDLFAKHTDTYGYISGNGEEAVSAEHFNCHCDNIVVDTPFTFPEPAVLVQPVTSSLVINSPSQEKAPCLVPAASSLRGPPAANA
jgi:hypothetical protein